MSAVMRIPAARAALIIATTWSRLPQLSWPMNLK